MPLNAIKHPLLAHKIALLRQDGISTKQFRELANEVASLLTYEATRNLPLENREIIGWQGKPIKTQMLSGKKLSIVPILRAGLGMLDGVLTLVPNAKVSVVGLYRDEETLNPVAYFDKIITDIGFFWLCLCVNFIYLLDAFLWFFNCSIERIDYAYGEYFI